MTASGRCSPVHGTARWASGAIATDRAGLEGVATPVTVTVANPPKISMVRHSLVTTSSVTITWTTSTPADSQVDDGTSTSYGSSTTLNPALVTSHSETLSGLDSGTLYHYRVRSRDAEDDLAVSRDFTFTTAAIPKPRRQGSNLYSVS